MYYAACSWSPVKTHFELRFRAVILIILQGVWHDPSTAHRLHATPTPRSRGETHQRTCDVVISLLSTPKLIGSAGLICLFRDVFIKITQRQMIPKSNKSSFNQIFCTVETYARSAALFSPANHFRRCSALGVQHGWMTNMNRTTSKCLKRSSYEY